ncbi:hypothetical protein K469DRAFT_112305 [Zopfia rhizophila CBS 207.26]|uniref:Uncharacterized protein n=1 Tax=Zopfia rhizophila CBS 207.26 TaxID=1314779 RepID=A0A6A6E980_9PEZI|nr:hypothetical protein K469DRAFT_112305 [Zopfia rhizophila CBS 207.26]
MSTLTNLYTVTDSKSSISSRSSMEDLKSFTTTSTASIKSSDSVTKPKTNLARKTWEAVKKHAKEHHQSVNAAYAVYYGGGRMLEAQNQARQNEKERK